MTLVCLQICRKNIAVSILACINHEVNKKKLYIYIYIYMQVGSTHHFNS